MRDAEFHVSLYSATSMTRLALERVLLINHQCIQNLFNPTLLLLSAVHVQMSPGSRGLMLPGVDLVNQEPR
jgi:hypothetical protein